MTSIGIYPDSLSSYFQSPNGVEKQLLRLDFKDENGDVFTRRFWLGVDTLVVGGHEWEGFANTDQLRAVSIGEVQFPNVRIAAKLDIKLNGVNDEFLRQVRQDIGVIYGAKGYLYSLEFDSDTHQAVSDPIEVFRGVCGKPKFEASREDGIGRRSITFAIDSELSSKDFPVGGKLTHADQQQRFAGDMGLEFAGSPGFETNK